jgi:hypothetical protein
MSELNEMECEEFTNLAAELALGVLTGRERAGAIAHMDLCDACRENVRQLTMTGEELLSLLPASEPPLGFETRVMERLGLAAPEPRDADRERAAGNGSWIGRIGRGRKGRVGRAGRPARARRLLTVAAVALTVVASGLGGWGLSAAFSSPARTLLSSAALVSAAHHTAGEIFFYNGHPHWMYMSVELGAGDGTVTCQVVGRDGQVMTLGTFRLAGGYGSWGGPAPRDHGPFTGARLIAADGTVLATARLSGM